MKRKRRGPKLWKLLAASGFLRRDRLLPIATTILNEDLEILRETGRG